jgi:DnaK suppressor protein
MQCWYGRKTPDMIPTEYASFQTALEAKQTELKLLLRDRDASAIGNNSDMLDQIQTASEGALAFCDLERRSILLGEVRAALGRIEAGIYGACIDCDEQISPKRLAALPWTPTCIVCRQAADRNRMLSPAELENGAGED